MRRSILVGVISGGLLLISGSSYVTFKLISSPAEQPVPTIVDVLGQSVEKPPFTTYSFESNLPPANLTIDTSTITYSNDVLIYRLTSPSGSSIAITQQKLPPGFFGSTLQGDESFDTPIGKATYSNTSDGRLTGSLVTTDGVLILTNTSDPIEESTFKDVLRFLRPARN